MDSQEIFDNEIDDWSEMYDLDTGITGKPTVINKGTISEKLKNVSNVIQFRVFCSAYRRAYVKSNRSEEDTEKKIVASIQRSLKCITMRYKDSVAGVYKHVSPDMVYNKMIQNAALLPEVATQWPFCLPWMFYNALSFQLYNQMTKDKYTLPNPVDLGSKTA